MPDEIAIGDVNGWDRQPIAPVAPALGFNKARAGQFRQDDGEKLGRDILRVGNRSQLHRPFAKVISKVLHRAYGIAGLLGQHRALSICQVGKTVKPPRIADLSALIAMESISE